MGKYLVILLVTMLMACSVNARKSPHDSPYSVYHEYAANFKIAKGFSEKRLRKIFSYLSPRYQDYLLAGRERTPDVLSRIVNETLNLPHYYTKEFAHYEKYDQDSACLLINTLRKDNTKVALYIKFVNPKNWLIDNVIIEFIPKDENFINTPICDSWQLQQKRMQLWTKP